MHGGTIELSGVRTSFSDFLLDVDLRIEGGSLVSLLGASGSGKTTTLRVIAGFESIDRGRVVYDGRDITHTKPWRRGFGFVPQNLVLFPHLEVAGNVAYGLRFRGKTKAEIRKRVGALLEMMGLTGYERRRVDTLSGGEQQRVAIARALAIQPGVLLLDEPFSALDAPLRREMRQEVVRLKQELDLTVVFVTHSQDEALSMSDRVVLLRDGSIVQEGRPEELFLRPVDRFAAGFIGAANIMPVTVEDVQSERITLGGKFRLEVSRGSNIDARLGQTLHLLVRPHRFTFGSRASVNAIRVRVELRRFLGDRYEYNCRSDGFLFRVTSTEYHEIGWDGYISFDPADGYFLA